MSYTYLLEQGEESSADSFADIAQYVLSNLMSMPDKSCLPANGTESCHASQSGMMSQPLMESHGVAWWMWSVADSRAKTYQVPGKGLVLQVQEVDCGSTWRELLMKYDHNTSLLKTHLCLWEEALSPSSVTLPQWGMMQDGVFWEQMTLGVITAARGAGYWPTPLKEEGPGCQQMKLTDAVAVAEGYCPRYHKLNGMEGRRVFTGKVNPDWAEWLMGWPVGWTNVSTELGMDKFLLWLQSHGIPCGVAEGANNKVSDGGGQ